MVHSREDKQVSPITPGSFGTADVSVLSVEGTAETRVHRHRSPLGTASSLQGPVREAEVLPYCPEEAVAIAGDLSHPVNSLWSIENLMLWRAWVLRLPDSLYLDRVLEFARVRWASLLRVSMDPWVLPFSVKGYDKTSKTRSPRLPRVRMPSGARAGA
jgi:hypothetical protein